MKKRLRLFDLRTPWFWVVAFWWGRRYGESSLSIEVYDERGTSPKWWCSRPGWESYDPRPHGLYAQPKEAGPNDV